MGLLLFLRKRATLEAQMTMFPGTLFFTRTITGQTPGTIIKLRR
jgi:hypothetical protein